MEIMPDPHPRRGRRSGLHLAGALAVAALAAASVWASPARADILEDFSRTIAEQAAAAAAPADLRRIPGHAVKGVMLPPHGRLVVIDDEVMRLAPGSKIYDLKNRIVMPSAVTAPANVRYTVDQYTHVHLIWLMPGKVDLKEKAEGNPGDN